MCQLCLENSVEIQTKDARKSYSEPIPNEIVSGVQVPQDTTLTQPSTTSVHIVSQAEDIADVKREVGTIKLTLANFENEMLKIVTRMRDENVMLREKVCDEKIRNTNEEKYMVLKQLEKIENTNKDLITQNMNLKDKNAKLQSECENLRTCIANNTELHNTLKQKLQDKDAEILQLCDELQPVGDSKHRSERNL